MGAFMKLESGCVLLVGLRDDLYDYPRGIDTILNKC